MIKLLYFFLISITIVGIFLRLYNLNWGAPFYFHPDERNIANAIAGLSFPNQMNPHFFAYGSLPIYIIYFTGILVNLFSSIQTHAFSNIMLIHFENAILIGRFYSALLSIGLLFLLYKTAKLLSNNQYTSLPANARQWQAGVLAVILGTFSAGFIQFAHFSTLEMWLTFFSLLLFYYLLKYIKTLKEPYYLLACLTTGILLSIKISSLVLILLPLFTLLLTFGSKHYVQYTSISDISRYLIKQALLLISICGTVLFITSPFVIFDTSSFLSSINYESSVALGTLPVFYTQEFYDTVLILFQFLHIYPFLLNPIITIVFIFSFLFLVYEITKTKNHFYLLLIAFFLSLFLSQAFLFAKWTRYIVPTLPFMYLIIAISLSDFMNNSDKKLSTLNFQLLTFIGIIALCGIFALSYFITAFVQPETRISASTWAKNNLNLNAKIASEVYDLGIVPFNQFFNKITLLNMYELGTNEKSNYTDALEVVKNSNYIILPSQRILKTRLSNSSKFPFGNKFYTSLLNGSLGFQKVYQTPCNIFCKITYLGDPIFSYEQTASVFDRPTVMIFKKND